jgi:hypothetical protein
MNNIKMKKIPVLFLIFNREDVTLRSLTSIKKYGPDKLYIAADGPRAKKPDEYGLCENTRNSVLKAIDWDCEIKTLFRDENLGCGLGVSSAISWFFENEEMGIILEDDCIPCENFFFYCEELLFIYKDIDRIMQINGFNPNVMNMEGNSYTFSRYPKIWGWATWRRAWAQFDFSMDKWPTFRKEKRCEKIFPCLEAIIHKYLWNRYYNELKRGTTPRTWDYQWSISVFMNEGLCIVPDVNLIINAGVDPTKATNCKKKEYQCIKLKYGNMNFPLSHPFKIELTEQTNKVDSQGYMRERWFGIKYKIKNLFRV